MQKEYMLFLHRRCFQFRHTKHLRWNTLDVCVINMNMLLRHTYVKAGITNVGAGEGSGMGGEGLCNGLGSGQGHHLSFSRS